MATAASNPPANSAPPLTSSDRPLGQLSHLLPPPQLTALCTSWLAEDCPSFDAGGLVVGAHPATAHLFAKSHPCVLAGAPFVTEVFRLLGCSVEWHVAEGTSLPNPPFAATASSDSSESAQPALTSDPKSSSDKFHVATVRGPARNILLGERPALNCLSRTSGIATASRGLLGRLRACGYAGILAGTRKTTPGFRVPEKYAMRVGGADPHRHDLASMVMVKDNHVWSCGGDVARAVAAARSAVGFSCKVEVECRDEGEARSAVDAGADVVMLDNFSPEEASRVSSLLRESYGPGRFLIEVSGGLTERNIGGYAGSRVDVISTSAIHQGVRHVDFSLKVVPRRRESLATLPGGGDEVAGLVGGVAAVTASGGDMALM